MEYDKELIAHKLQRWDKFITDYHLPDWETIPDFGLYMDQVIVLLEQYLSFIPAPVGGKVLAWERAFSKADVRRFGDAPVPEGPILAVTVASIVLGFTPFIGVTSVPPSLAPTFLQLDIKGALDIGLVSVIFAFLFVDLFDNSGTLIGVAKRAGLMGKDGHMPKMGRALIADSTAAMAGSLLGTSTTTSYIESAAGVSAGGRTGLTAIVVAILFLLALFFSPLAASVPAYATAPALLFVAVLMSQGLAEIDWDDITVAAPVVITALAMPFTYSIANGIAFGFIAWTAIKLLSGRYRELNPALVILSILFVIKLGWFNA